MMVTIQISKKLATTPAYWLSIILAIVVVAWTLVAVLNPTIFRDPPEQTGNARGTALVLLVVVVPLLLISMRLAAGGSLRARIVWVGALCYIVYNSVVFTFGVAFNPLFLMFVASLSLSVWALVAMLQGSKVDDIEARILPTLAVGRFATYLLIVALLFGFLWLSQIVPALFETGRPAFLSGTNMLVNPIHVVDLGFALPLCILSSFWLRKRRAWGYFLSGVMLVMTAIETFGVSIDQVFGHIHEPTASLAFVPVFGVISLIGLLVVIFYLRNLGENALST